MRCTNCGKEIPNTAKICESCEAPVQPEPTEEEKQAVREMLKQMPPEALEQFRTAFLNSGTAEEFVNRIMTGDCPQCGSSDTGDCENDPEIAELLVGRCFQCGQLWCTECGRLLERESPCCECWADEKGGHQ